MPRLLDRPSRFTETGNSDGPFFLRCVCNIIVEMEATPRSWQIPDPRSRTP